VIFDEDTKLEEDFFYTVFKPYVEKRGEKCIFIHYTCTDSIYDMLQKKKDIDVITDNGKRNISYSLKTVKEIYPKIFIETISNTTKNTPGWAFYSEADYLVYTMGFPGNILCRRFPVSSMVSLELRNGKYKKGYGETRDKNGKLLYRTEGKLVPPEDIKGLVKIPIGGKHVRRNT
jgi:hypothetical protein